MKHYDFHFDSKSVASNGSVMIEGFSNRNVSDRVRERMDPKGGRLENYKKNPVVLFNHGKDEAFGVMPVGKALAIEAQEEGIHTRVHISNSKTEKISVVRDLVEEGILKTFSLGYETLNESKDADGTTVLTDWELLEQSIVPIPMNQDSIGSLVKRYKRIGNNFGCKYLRVTALNTKGALVAAALASRIDDLQASKVITDRDKALTSVAELASCKMLHVKEVLAGDRPIDLNMAKAFAAVLGLKAEDLLNIRKLEIKMPDNTGTKNSESLPDQKAIGEMILHTISVPKSMFDEAENAKEYVESHGFKADSMSENDEAYQFRQSDAEGLDVSKGVSIDMGEGVIGVAAPKAPAKGMDEKPKEDEKIEEKSEDKQPLEEEEKKEAATPADLLAQALETGDNHERMKQLVEQALILLGDGKTGSKALPPTPSGADAVPQDENPYLLAARQTNALLGTLIVEIQKIGQKLEGQMEKPESEMTEMSSEDDADEIKGLASLRNYQQTIDIRLKRLGV